MIVNNEAINYSIILNRNLQLKIDENTDLKIEVEIFVFQDDDGNFKINADYTQTNCIIHNGKKITGTHRMVQFLHDYDEGNRTNISKIVNDCIINHYGKYNNQQIRELAKEHNITL